MYMYVHVQPVQGDGLVEQQTQLSEIRKNSNRNNSNVASDNTCHVILQGNYVHEFHQHTEAEPSVD